LRPGEPADNGMNIMTGVGFAHPEDGTCARGAEAEGRKRMTHSRPVTAATLLRAKRDGHKTV
jgi:hypothetical protein